ncbi:MAG: pyridoxal-phosphate dependent enzyme [Planctomycetes bacterium]|nr:pyridoxal-phosphate dependent enzyme [Planctomycetota bacterium]
MQIDESVRSRAAERCRERGVVIPTFAQLDDPSLIPAPVHARLADVGLWDVDPINLFRITWRNEPVEHGGRFNDGNFIEFPSELTGVDARIVGLVGKWFPTGAHKVGAGFGCLVPRLVSGAFDPTRQKAVWPSTGNYCRGGAFDCALLGCDAIGILPEEMSRERFTWLAEIGAEIIATPGCESNVKEIYDKCWEIRRTRPDCVIFNQFEELGNSVWHHHVTGRALERVFRTVAGERDRLAAFVSATGSAGTIAAGDYLKTVDPSTRIVAAEALQCPTLLRAGFGAHAIEGIGDKHVPWIHNVRNTDVVCAIDDQACLALMRLFNEPAGRDALVAHGVDADLVGSLDLLGISCICNLAASIKTARHFGLGSGDVVMTVLTDSMQLYGSRLEELAASEGPYRPETAWRHLGRYLEAITDDHLRELTHVDRRALHNLKYFTWVEQQQRSVEDLERLWDPGFWTHTYAQVDAWDRLIEAFNECVSAGVGAGS